MSTLCQHRYPLRSGHCSATNVHALLRLRDLRPALRPGKNAENFNDVLGDAVNSQKGKYGSTSSRVSRIVVWTAAASKG